MDGDEKVLAIIPFVTASPVRLADRLAYYWGRPFAPKYGHLILTNRRLAHIRLAKTQKITEVRREYVSSGSINWKGLEDYTAQDLSADVAHGANLDLPLETLVTIRTIRRNDSVLELDIVTPKGRTGLRFFLLAGLYEDRLGSVVPVATGGSTATVADMIRRAKAGYG